MDDPGPLPNRIINGIAAMALECCNCYSTWNGEAGESLPLPLSLVGVSGKCGFLGISGLYFIDRYSSSLNITLLCNYCTSNATNLTKVEILVIRECIRN